MGDVRQHEGKSLDLLLQGLQCGFGLFEPISQRRHFGLGGLDIFTTRLGGPDLLAALVAQGLEFLGFDLQLFASHFKLLASSYIEGDAAAGKTCRDGFRAAAQEMGV